MKTQSIFFIGTMCLIMSFTVQAGDWAGYWHCQTTNLSLEIQESDHGIRVRQENRNWINAQKYGQNRYRDQKGNRYRLIQDGTLEYSTREQKYIMYRNNYDSRQSGNDWYGKLKQRDEIRARRDFVIDGRWTNPNTGIKIQINERRNQIRVKFPHSGWETFHKYHQGVFKDNDGNRLAIKRRGIIEFTSSDGDLFMRLYKGQHHGKRKPFIL